MDLQIKVKVMDTNTKVFAPANLFNFYVKQAKGKNIGKIITEFKKKAVEMAKENSALSRFKNWSFRAYVTENPYLNK